MRYAAGIIGGLLIFVFVTMISAFILGRMFGETGTIYDVFPAVVAPLIIGSLAGVHSFLATASLRDRSRAAAVLGKCIHCEYDLRGSKDRCPECGQAFGPYTFLRRW